MPESRMPAAAVASPLPIAPADEDVQTFIARHQLAPAIGIACDLLAATFDTEGTPTVSRSTDGETDEQWVELRVAARGAPRRVSDAYRRFTDSWLAATDARAREHIRVRVVPV